MAINVSNEWKAIVADCTADRTTPDFTAKATILLANGTTLPITAQDIVMGGLSINDSVSASNSFQIGTAFINENDILLNNIEHKFDDVDFTDAVVIPYVGLKKSTATEWIKKGKFTVDEATISASIISLISLDDMNKLDVPFSGVTASFPITALMLAQSICTHCGVALSSTPFTNQGVTITRRPTDEALTCRSILGWIAQMGGNFARCNVDGVVELKWYNISAMDEMNIISGGTFKSPSDDTITGGTFISPSTDTISGGTFSNINNYHHLYSFGTQPTIGTDDVVITGVRVKAMGVESDYGETALFGREGYVIEIGDNPLIQEGMAQNIANTIGAKLVGMRFRTASVQTITDPSREAGDIGILSHKNNTYPIIFSNYRYQFGSSDTITSDAETPSKNSSGYSPTTKVIVEARKVAKQELSAYDVIKQQFSNLIANAMGVFRTLVQQDNGGEIEYIHNQPIMEESAWRQYTTSGGMIQENKVDGVWTITSATDVEGNALYNVLTARKINVDLLIGETIQGKNIISPFGLLGKMEFINGALAMYNENAHKSLSIGNVSNADAYGSAPIFGVNADVPYFGMGMTGNDFASFAMFYKYIPDELKHYLYGACEHTGAVKFNSTTEHVGNAKFNSTTEHVGHAKFNSTTQHVDYSTFEGGLGATGHVYADTFAINGVGDGATATLNNGSQIYTFTKGILTLVENV